MPYGIAEKIIFVILSPLMVIIFFLTGLAGLFPKGRRAAERVIYSAYEFGIDFRTRHIRKGHRAIRNLVDRSGWMQLQGMEQLEAVAGWIGRNIQYSNTCRGCKNAYDVIITGKGDCTGQSQLVRFILKRMGVGCRQIAVTESPDGNQTRPTHSVCVVELDGKRYIVDTARYPAHPVRGVS